MGARLISQVLARWTHVSDRAFRVLVRMALTALDDASPGSPAGLYFGGRELLAMTLRNERGGKRDSVLRNVRYALDELIDEGAIERTHAGRAGQNAVYRLRLDAPRSIDKDRTDGPSQGEPSIPPEGERGIPPQGEPGIPNRGNAAFPPRNHEEPVEELLQEMEKLDVRTAVTVAREDDAEEPVSIDATSAPVLRLVADEKPRPIGSRRWSSRGTDAIAEAMARRAAARAQHQNAGETA